MLLSLMAASLVLLGISGCGPEMELAWLPDSSGFVYTRCQDGSDGGYNRIVHCDLVKEEIRTIVADTGTQTIRPAVSPDGKHIAVAGLVATPGGPDMMQIVIYDLEGKEWQRSKPCAWSRTPGDDAERIVKPTALYWSPRGDRLLVHDYDGEPKTGVYDMRTGRLNLLPHALPGAYGGSPFRPDGKGFLLNRPREDGKLTVCYRDWSGKESVIAMKPDTMDSGEKVGMLTRPGEFSSSWRGREAVVTYGEARIRIDTAKRTGILETVPSDEAEIDGKVIRQRYVFRATDVSVRILEHEDEKNATYLRLEVSRPKAKAADTVVQRASRCVLYPSPNGKLVAVGCRELDLWGRDQNVIFVIDQEGSVTARIVVDQ
jgi:hypothetical protein